MQNIRLNAVNKKSLLPLIMTAIQSLTTWLVPTLYSHQVHTNIQHTFSNQLLVILFIFMFNFLVFDRFTNKISTPIFLSMTGVTVLAAALAFSSISPTISILLFLCMVTLSTFFTGFKNNWAGLILYTISSAFILPEVLFYIQCGFLSTNFLSVLVVPLLGFLFIFYPFFINKLSYGPLIHLSLGILCIVILLVTHLTTFGLIAVGTLIISWLATQFIKQSKLHLIVNVILYLIFSVFLILWVTVTNFSAYLGCFFWSFSQLITEQKYLLSVIISFLLFWKTSGSKNKHLKTSIIAVLG